MRGLLRTVIANPLAVLLGAAALVLLGLYAAGRMPVDLFPNLDVPVVNIIAHYPGAAPEDLELLVTRPIEEQVRAIPGVRRVSSATTLGISQVTVEFTWGTTVTAARQQVEGRLAVVRNLLPPGVEPVLESIGTTLQEVIGYLVIGPGDPVALRNTVRLDLTTRLMAIDGVASVAVLGGDRRAFLVRAEPRVLRRLGLTAGDLVRTLRQNNLTAIGGYLERGAREYPLRGDARLQSLEDLRALPLTAGERRVPLGAVAAVREGWVPRHYEVHGDGLPAVAFSVRKQPGADTLQVARAVDRAVGELQRLFPAGTRIEKYYDQSEVISEARDEIVRDLLLGTVLAALVLYFFLGALRPTLAVAATIPLTLIATLALMRLAGLGFNVITMSALALAVGMIIDDTVVVAENIFRHRQAGEPPAAATVAGAMEIAAADASGTFTTVAAFLPLLLITGLAALFLRPFGLTISAALLVSLVVSLTVIPLLFSRGGIAPPERDFAGARVLRRLDATLQTVLWGAFRHPARTLILAVLGFGVAGLGAFFLGSPSLLPPIDEGAILIEYILPPGTALAESGRVGDLLDRVALAEPGVTAVYRRTGSPAAGYQVEGVNRGEILVKLAPRSVRRQSVTEITARLRQAYGRVPGVVFLFHQPTQEKIDESFSGLPALFGLTIFGSDPEILAELAAKAEDLLAAQPAVSNIVNNTKVRAPEILVQLDYRRLALHRVAAADVLTELQALRVGVEATRIVRQREEISILVQLAGEDAESVAALERLPVATAAGGTVPLAEVAQIGVVQAPTAVTRLNGEREVTLLAEVEGSIPSLVARLQERLDTLSWPAGYRFEFTGQYRVLLRTAGELLAVMAGAVLLIYLIMAMQFRSGWQPLAILATVPFSLAGALAALAISRQGIDVSVGMGALTLVGISVNNAIVLLDYANRREGAGLLRQQALQDAASVRLRPILLTATTTIFALVPAALGLGVGSKVFQPFAITVIGGLLAGTVVTLVVVPTLAGLQKVR